MSTSDPNLVLTTLKNGHSDYPAASATDTNTTKCVTRSAGTKRLRLAPVTRTALSAIFIDPPIVMDVCGPLVAISDAPEGVEARLTAG
jgi:hypothetical protein